MHSHVPGPHANAVILEGSEQLIPDHPEFAEVHLRVLVFALMVPTMNFGNSQNRSEYANGIIEV